MTTGPGTQRQPAPEPAKEIIVKDTSSLKIGDYVKAVTKTHGVIVGAVDYIYVSGRSLNIIDGQGRIHYVLASEAEALPMPAPSSSPAAAEELTRPGNEDFMRAAVKALTKVARTNKTFTTDEVWAQLAKTNPEGFNVEPRALGALMLTASKQGAIKTTTRTRSSKRGQCHGRPVRVWKSLLYTGK